jgi:VCBS repeat-containing protein
VGSAGGVVTGWNTSTLILNPFANLTAGTGYYVKVAATAVTDLAGNAYAGITDATTFNFVTLNTDGSTPVVPPYGGQPNSQLGFSVSSAGDVNGDGYDDVIVSANKANTDAGAAYVVYGNAAGAGVSLVNGTIAPSLGFKIAGASGTGLGYSVSAAGDVNGDGFADVIVGAANGNMAYVVYGSASAPSAAALDFSTTTLATSNGFSIKGVTTAGAFFGASVSSAGDVNGDGLADLMVGVAGNSTLSNATFIIYGKTNAANLDLSANTIAPSDGYKINGIAGSMLGLSTSNAGDVNGDGLADQIISAYNQSSGAGTVYIIYGNSSGTGVDLNGVMNASTGYMISGGAGNYLGYSVSSAGDVNGDGLADVVVTAQGINAAYVVYGNASRTSLDLSGGITNTNGYKIIGQAGTSFGYSVSSAGDVNGDGLGDVIVGAIASGTNSGTAYVVYGNTTGATVDISTGVIAASNGFKLATSVASGQFGHSVSNAGDINGDGLSDLIIGARATNSYAGAYYIVLGGTQTVTSAVNLTGTATDEAVMGTAGNDTLVGGGGVDRFFAGKGNDTVVLQASDVTNLSAAAGTTREAIQGGEGFDTLQVSAASVNLDLTAISNAGAMGFEENSRIESIERINLGADATANTLSLAAKDVNDMSGFNAIHTTTASADGKTWSNVTGTALSATTQFHQVVVDGTSADTLNLGSGFALVGTVNNGAATYKVYQNTATNSQVIVDSAISNVVMDLPPTLVSTSPADNGQVAATNLTTNLTLTFNEVVKAGTGVIELYNASTNALVESFNAATGVGSAGGVVTGWNTSTLTLNPFANLTAGTGYYVKVAATAVTDLAGNAYAGITDATTFNFLTLNADGSVPAVPPYVGQTGSYLGYSVSSAGDVNGDGYDDIIVGAKGDNSVAGAAYVIYGNAAGAGVSLAGGTIAPSLGFKIAGATASQMGYSVSGAGDINGDGFADVIVGAIGNSTTSSASYIVYGGASNAGLDLSGGTIASGSGFKITGSTGNKVGYGVASAGDVNGDGLADLIVGAPGTSSWAGATYIVYGSTALSAGLNLSTDAIDASNGFKLTGAASSYLGQVVSSVGDLNGDGFSDVVVSSAESNSAYVLYGSATGMNSTNGFTLTGDVGFGKSVTSLGDINGDGFADLAIGAPGENTQTGAVYVVYGKAAGTSFSVAGGTIAPSLGFKITGQTASFLGSSVASAGDVNGDGLADLIVGANAGNKQVAAATYVVYGTTTGANINLSSGTIAASQGFKLSGATDASFGTSVSSAGDINGDGLSDLIIGSPFINSTPGGTNNNTGAYFVVLGGTQTVTSAVNLTGTATDEAVMGTAGNDTLVGGGGVDRFFAGKGNDTIVLQASDVTNLSAAAGTTREAIQGGEGFDTLQVSAASVNLDLTAISNAGAMGFEENSRIESIERINLGADATANTLTLTAKDVNDMADFNSIHTGTASADGKTWTNVGAGTALSATTKFHQVVVDGTSADTLTLEVGNGYWANVGEVNNGTTGYYVYQNTDTNSQVIVDKTVVVDNKDSSPAAPVGVNDTASIGEAGGTANGTAGTALTSTTSGFTTLNVLSNDTDANVGDTMTVSVIRKGTTGTTATVAASTTSANGRSVVGDFGTLVIGADGSYTYAVDNANATVQALNVGGFVNDVFTYTVRDAGGLTSTATLTVRANGANDAPTVANPLVDAVGQPVGSLFSYTVPANAFADVDSASLTYTANDLTNGALPSWLAFNAATRTFSGTPTEIDSGTYSIKVVASDGSLTGVDIFTLIVDPLAYTFDSLASLTNRGASGSAYTAAAKNLSLSGSLVNRDTDAADLEYQIYSGANTGSFINFDGTKLVAGTKMKSFSASFQLFLSITDGDGVAFSFGDKTSLSAVTGTTTNTSNYDWGYSTGLSVEFDHGAIPVIRWNGTILTNTTEVAIAASDTVANATSVNVGPTGIVTVRSNAINVASATIPGWSSMTATEMEGWQFGFSGRTGSNAGSAWVDNLNIAGSRVVGPVVIDLNQDGEIGYQQVLLDVDGDGRLDNTAWVAAQDGVLVWDKYGDGHVRDNSQFAFEQYGGTSDLTGLAVKFDTNRDGVLDAEDEKFAEFSVWQDVNQNGVSDAGEVRSLADWGITSINLVSDGVQRTPVAGVTEVGQSTAALADGSSMQVADALFAYNALDYSLTGAASGDTLNLLGSNMTLDLSSVAAVHSNVTAIDLTGSAVNGTTGANTLKLNLADVLTLPLASSAVNGVHKLTLTGDANDTVELDLSQWANTGTTVTEGDHTYAVYNASSAAAAQLLIDQHMVLANHG